MRVADVVPHMVPSECCEVILKKYPTDTQAMPLEAYVNDMF